MSYLDKSIREIHEAFVKKNLTPSSLLEEVILRVEADQNNSFEALDFAAARKIASELGEVEKDNLLWGIPYFAKDNISTKNLETTGSSNILNGYVPVFNATVIEKLNARHAVLIGKTTLDELAMGGTGTTGHKGTTFNPWDKLHQHIVGGSSCGSASAVAANIVPFALGTDTGDSIRKPASYAGLVGMKPTWGRVSRFGVFPFAPSLDHVGVFTRSVEDNAIVLAAISGGDNEDATSSFNEVEDYVNHLTEIIKNKKVCYIKEILDVSDKKIKQQFNSVISSLTSLGYEVVEESIDMTLLNAILPTYLIISCAEATSCNSSLDGIKYGPYPNGMTSFTDLMRKARSTGFSQLIKRRFLIGSFALAKENQEFFFKKAQRARGMIVQAYQKLLSKYAFIIVPASPTTAPTIDNVKNNIGSKNEVGENHLAIQNFGGFPSITLPLGIEEGLPFGINASANLFAEEDLYKFVLALEKITKLSNLSAREEK